MVARTLLTSALLMAMTGCARRDHVVHYASDVNGDAVAYEQESYAEPATTEVYVEASAAPSVYNSTVSYETYADSYEEVWVEDPTYGYVMEICPASIDEWDGYNVVEEIIATPRGQDLQARGRFIYSGRWIWVPGFNPVPHTTIMFSTYHTLPRYHSYRSRRVARRIAAPQILRARVRPRVSTYARPSVRVRSPSSRFRSNPLHPTPEPDVHVRHRVTPRHHVSPRPNIAPRHHVSPRPNIAPRHHVSPRHHVAPRVSTSQSTQVRPIGGGRRAVSWPSDASSGPRSHAPVSPSATPHPHSRGRLGRQAGAVSAPPNNGGSRVITRSSRRSTNGQLRRAPERSISISGGPRGRSGGARHSGRGGR